MARPCLQRSWRRRLENIEPPESWYYLAFTPEGRPEESLFDAEDQRTERPQEQNGDAFHPDPSHNYKDLLDYTARDDARGNDLKSGSPNYDEAYFLEACRQRRLGRALSVVISKVAEDLSGPPKDGDDEWSVEALLQRRLTRQPLNSCRQSREKESLVLILDTSGSCLPQARFYNRIADAAFKAKDLDIYAGPNAGLRARRTRHGWVEVDDRKWPFVGRTIIFFGDYDGGDMVVESGRKNKVYWFCSEGGRYPSMSLHPWCSYTLRDFKGFYFDCNTEDDFLRLFKKVQ